LQRLLLTSIVFVNFLFLTACDKPKDFIAEPPITITKEMKNDAESRKQKEFCANASLLGWETDGKCDEYDKK
jgi:hypothetical protein